MKRDARFLGIDDAPFSKGDERVRVVGVVTRGPQYIEGVLSTDVAVDGHDATDRLLDRLIRSRFRSMWRAVFLNGIFLGGFNLVDVDRMHEALGVPVMALIRSAPRPRLVRHALTRAFKDWEPVWARVAELEPEPLPGLRLWATLRGATAPEAARLVRALTVRGWIPEPLRLAHVIASGVTRGESRGKA